MIAFYDDSPLHPSIIPPGFYSVRYLQEKMGKESLREELKELLISNQDMEKTDSAGAWETLDAVFWKVGE
jgi:hypothetical protein